MRTLPLLASAGLLLAVGRGCVGECAEPEPLSIGSGSYRSLPEAAYGSAEHGLPHAGPVDRVEVDRAAGLVRVHGRTTSGAAFVETFRIVESVVD